MIKTVIVAVLFAFCVGVIIGHEYTQARQLSLANPSLQTLLHTRLQQGNPGVLSAPEMTGTVVSVAPGEITLDVLGFNPFSLVRGTMDKRVIVLANTASTVRLNGLSYEDTRVQQAQFAQEYEMYQKKLASIAPGSSALLPTPPTPPASYTEVPVTLSDLIPGSVVRVEGQPGILLQEKPTVSKVILLSLPQSTSGNSR